MQSGALVAVQIHPRIAFGYASGIWCTVNAPSEPLN